MRTIARLTTPKDHARRTPGFRRAAGRAPIQNRYPNRG
jgi:hypothetical protein